jgi:hypothetical protein
MPSRTISNIIDKVYRHLGDGGHFDGTPNPTVPLGDTVAKKKAHVVAAIQSSLEYHVAAAEEIGVMPIHKSMGIDVANEDYSSQTITISATGGTFTVSMIQGGVTRTTSALAFDVSSGDMLTALQGICLVAPSSVALGSKVYTVLWDIDDYPTRMNIPLLTTDATSLTGDDQTATVAGTDSGRGFQQEYDLDYWLVDSSLTPDYRANLFVVRSDIDKPEPMLWSEDGDFRQRFFIDVNWQGYQWDYPPVGYSYGTFMYRRGTVIGFVSTPTAAQTLTAYYVPTIPVVNENHTLQGVDLTIFQGWLETISLQAARGVARDVGFNEDRLRRLERDAGVEFGRYMLSVKRAKGVVRRSRKPRWSG